MRTQHFQPPFRAAVPAWLSVLVAVALALGAAPPASGQDQGRERSPARATAGDAPEERLVLFAYSLEHRPGTEALELTLPLLSDRGTARLLDDGRTLEVRDRRDNVRDIVRRMRVYDRPGDRYRVEVMVVKASVVRISPVPPPSPEIPAPMIARWQELLPYDHFELVARAELAPHISQQVIYEVGAGYRVSFQLQPIYSQPRVKLSNFRLLRLRGQGEQELIHTNLNPWLGKSLALGLAKDEASRTALMVVIRATDEGRPSAGPEKE